MSEHKAPNPVALRIFDIRNIVGSLLFIYGVLLTLAGIFPGLVAQSDHQSGDNPVDLYVGADANWWVGLVLLVVGAGFMAWAALRPTKPKDVEEELES